MTNAAANRLIAASSAIVERTSAVDARSDAATSWGDGQQVGLDGQRPLEGDLHGRRIRPGREHDVDARQAREPARVAVAPSSAGASPAAVAIGITIVRPEDPGTGPVAGEDAGDRDA